MPELPRGQANTTDNINWFTSIGGVKTNMFLVEFQILYIGGGLPGIQVFPLAGWEAVTNAPGRFATGSYYAYDNAGVHGWTPDLAATVGTYRINWRWKYQSGSAYQTGAEDFSVLLDSSGSPGYEAMYCTVADMRDEGVPSTGVNAVTDARLEILIRRVSQMIDQYTNRWFEPRNMTFNVDGLGTEILMLEHPIIQVTAVSVDDVEMSLDDLIIYNRHVTQNLRSPDDRENPKIEVRKAFEGELEFLLGMGIFPRGQQNIEVVGVFGYTDHDGSVTGVTPLMITEAAKWMVLRELTPKYSASGEGESWRVISQRTRDQAITYANPGSLGVVGVGCYTGDTKIDRILMQYAAPPRLRSA